MPILITNKKKAESNKATEGIVKRICYIDRELSKKHGLPFGWFEWDPDSLVAKAVPEEQTAVVRVAKAGNAKHRQFSRHKRHVYRKEIRKNTLTQEQQDEIDIEGVATAVLIDWDGFYQPDPDNPDGDPIPLPYSEETSIKLLKNDSDLLNLISEISVDDDNYESEVETVKNFKKV